MTMTPLPNTWVLLLFAVAIQCVNNNNNQAMAFSYAKPIQHAATTFQLRKIFSQKIQSNQMSKKSKMNDSDHNDNDFSSSSHFNLNRRTIITSGLIGAIGISPWSSALAAGKTILNSLVAPQTPSAQLESGLLEARVTENVLSPPPYGIEGSDIFYPSWFLGSWKSASTTSDVMAPCGIGFFGGNATYTNALKDIGNVLNYECRFVSDNNGHVIADREFNVRSIAKEAMGANSVVSVSLATPNKFSCVLSPEGSPSMLSVELLVLNRRQEIPSENQFDCSEVVREIASPMDRPRTQQQQQQQTLLKEIETASLYTYLPEQDQIICRQRSAAFLLPSNDNPIALQMWQMSRGRPIDVRYYDVVYTRKT